MNIILEADTVIEMYQRFQLGKTTRIKLKIISSKLGYGRLVAGVIPYGNPPDYLQKNG